MLKALTGLSVGLLVLVPSGAQAQSPASNEMRLEQLLNRLDQLSSPQSSGRTATNFEGTFEFTVVANFPAGFNFTGGIFCQVSIFHSGATGASYSSQRSAPMRLRSGSAKCVNPLRVHMSRAESANPVFPNVTVYSHDFSTSLAQETVFGSQSLGPIPLPATGSTTKLDADFEF